MAYIQRHLQESVLQLSQEYPAILIAGPRGSGKTTMLKMLIDVEDVIPREALVRNARTAGLKMPSEERREFISLDDLRARDVAKNDPELFLQMHKPPLLISEVQYAPELLPFIKKYIEKNNRPGDFWLTGSHLYELMDTVYKELAGSVALLNLFPFSRGELIGNDLPPIKINKDDLGERIKSDEALAKDSLDLDATSIFEFIWQGSMPEGISSDRFDSWEDYYTSYLDSCIRRDVRDIGGSIDSIKFLRFVTTVASHDSEVLNVKLIADEAGIDQATAKNWLGILANIGLIFYIHPYTSEKLKRGLKTPKLYFYDTGLVCYLTSWPNARTAMRGAMASALFENYVVAEIVKGYSHHGALPRIYYYKDRDASEISLILEEDGKLSPIMIRLSASPNKRMASSFALIDKEGIEVADGAIICLNDKFDEIAGGVYTVPVGLL